MALIVGGTTVTGTQTLEASTLTGTASAINGSNITNLDAADLSGTLPALNGSNLTNLPAGTHSAGSVGSYALGYANGYSGGFVASAGTETSSFRYRNVAGNSNSSSAAGGTWRAHGSIASGSDNERTTVFHRIS